MCWPHGACRLQTRSDRSADPKRGEDALAQRKLILITALTLMVCGAAPASAQKQGGVLKVFFFDSPASMSIHEEATIAGQGPMMGLFNNLILYDQKVPQAGMKSIV